jgi:N-acetylglutamate synthase-like GNAT family acetyltransferase
MLIRRFYVADSSLAMQYYERAIWINAVLVAPEYRRQGVGSGLIRAAEEAARRVGIPSLYALTEVPDLYSKLSWSVFNHEGADFVMAWNAPPLRPSSA